MSPPVRAAYLLALTLFIPSSGTSALITSPPDGWTDPNTTGAPSGTPFDEFVPPRAAPLKAPEPWEVEQAAEIRTHLGFGVGDLDQLFDTSEDPDSVEALSRSAIGAPLSDAELAEYERRMQMGDAQSKILIEAQRIPGFAGNYIDQPSGGSQVLLFTAAADPDAILALTSQYDYPMYLEVLTVERSVAELADSRDQAVKAMQASGLVYGEQWALYTDLERNAVVLEYVEAAKDAAEQTATELRIESAPFTGYAEEVDCTDTACLPLAGGTNTGENDCTWGFVLFSNGNLRVSTAGHCASQWPTRTWNGMTLNRISWVYAEPVDFAVYEIPTDTWATNDLYRSDSGTNRFGLQVAGHRNPQQNEVVCKRGMTTDATCGVVESAVPGEYARASYRSCPGDSGAPITTAVTLYRRTAVGSHSQGLPNSPGCPDSPAAGVRQFMLDQYISSSFNHTVYASTSPRRDFAISLYDRALGHAPDAAGLAYWQAGACDAANLGAMANFFFTGAEFKSLAAVNDVNNASELRERFFRLYRGDLRRGGAFSEAQSWVDWVYSNAPTYPGATLTEKRENAYNGGASYFTGAAEFASRFTSGGDGEIPLCAN